jgi:anion-transporting  ArsA/GET3 family ATPase
MSPPALDVDRLIDDRRTRVIVCCGSGGVGKTTTAAAIGLRAAERGRHVVVLTVDPARRLAQSMGLTTLDNTPRPVPLPDREGAGTSGKPGKPRKPGRPGTPGRPGRPGKDAAPDGSLHAMMLDMKRTFDEIVEAHADPDRAAQILANPFYQSLSSGFSGTQEYMAMEKLGQLRRAEEWDLIVVDTPPSRSALDFLDAPQRLGRFLDGRLIRLLVVPAKVGGRAYLKMLNASFSMVTGVLTKVLGAQVLKDVQTFVSALDTMFGGFRERADYTYQLLRAPGTAFLVIAAPEPDALREASYFVERLAQEGMPLAGLVLNRVHRSPAARLSAARSLAAAETLQAANAADAADAADGQESRRSSRGAEGRSGRGISDRGGSGRGISGRGSQNGKSSLGGPGGPGGPGSQPGAAHALTIAALRLHAERMQLAVAERRVAEHFTTAHPHVPVAEVPAQPDDVHDLAGLGAVGDSFSTE